MCVCVLQKGWAFIAVCWIMIKRGKGRERKEGPNKVTGRD